MPGLHSHFGYLSRLLARCERDEVRTNVDIHTLVWESSITRQDIRDTLIFFDSKLIYRHVSESFETRWEHVESVEDDTNVPFTLSFSSCLVLSRRECKLGITVVQTYSTPIPCPWSEFLYMSLWVPKFVVCSIIVGSHGRLQGKVCGGARVGLVGSSHFPSCVLCGYSGFLSGMQSNRSLLRCGELLAWRTLINCRGPVEIKSLALCW